ncbi:MAG TPA: MaoC/PaaZ C-terminal domain-containing protein [Methylomirabilota bacterium]|jgi:acyl dehydratase|nr:MaoC/PaaZ C-terminal domain-containing protein [Methylomirabilota bacterium]
MAGVGSRLAAGVLFLRVVDAQSAVFFEDLKIGQEYTSPGRTVTETDVVLFAGLSGDYNVLHTDAEHMKASLFGERIAHGLLGLAIQQGLASRGEPTAAHGSLAALKWKFKGPIRLGDTIHARSRIAGLEDGALPGHGLVTVERQVINQHGEVVQEGETAHLLERRTP